MVDEREYVEDGAVVESSATEFIVAENGTELIEASICDGAELRVYDASRDEWRRVRWEFKRNKPVRLYYLD